MGTRIDRYPPVPAGYEIQGDDYLLIDSQANGTRRIAGTDLVSGGGQVQGITIDVIGPAYDSSVSYSEGDAVTNSNKLYVANDDTTGTWNPAKWDEHNVVWYVDSEVNVLRVELSPITSNWSDTVSKLNTVTLDIAPEHSDSATYNTNSLVLHDNQLYKCTLDNVSGAWATTQAYFSSTTIAAELSAIRTSISTLSSTVSGLDTRLTTAEGSIATLNARKPIEGEEYDSSKTYNSGNYVIQNNKFYTCRYDNTTGAWDASKWLETDIPTELQSAKASGGTEVIANPAGTGTADLEKVSIAGTIYDIPSGGGTTVVANPSGTPTDTLETVQIGADIYEIVGGGGGGSSYEEVTLWSGSQDASTSGDIITLDDNISNYDMINITLHHKTEPEGGSALLAVSGLTIGGNYIYAIYPVDGVYACFDYTSDNQLKVKSAMRANPLTYTKVTGMKFGGGGGEPGGFDSLYDAITATGSYTLSASIDNYDAVLVVGGQISGNNRSLRQSTLIPKANYYDVGPNGVGDAFAVNCSMWNSTYRVMFGFSNNTTILVREIKDVDIIGVYGLKLGSGGGSSTHNYSTSEHIVGKWIDGSDVYEQTIEITSYDGATTSISIPGLSKLVSITGFGIYNNSQCMSLPYYYNSNDYVRMYTQPGYLKFESGSGYRSDYTKTVITIQYTKSSS